MTEEMSFQVSLENCQGFSDPDGGIVQIFPHRDIDTWGGVFKWGVLARSGLVFF